MTNSKWLDNSLISGKSIFTVLPDGTLEIRGPGWEHRKRKGDTINTDRPRICHLGSEEAAKRMAEILANMDDLEGDLKNWRQNI